MNSGRKSLQTVRRCKSGSLKMKLKEIPEKIKKIKNIEIILAVIIGLIILII